MKNKTNNNNSTRAEILLNILKGDSSQLASYLSTWTSVTAAIEFLVNPTIGRLSDAFGRKKFMMLSPYAAVILKTWVLLRPSLLSLTTERIVCDGLRTLCGTTMGQTCITDLVDPKEIGNEISSLYAYMGLAIIGSPLIAAQMSARGTYKAAVLLAAIQLVADQFYLKETLKKDQRREFKGFANPFEFFKLFTSGPALASICTVMALQFTVDPKIMADPWFTMQMGTLKWTRKHSQLFTAFIGLGLLVGRKFTAKTLHPTKGIGASGHTTLTNAVTVVENLILGFAPSSASMLLVAVLSWIGGQRMNGVKQMASSVAFDASKSNYVFGKGEFSGLTANLRALIVAATPLIHTKAYQAGLKMGSTGGAFVTAGVFVLIAEYVHRKYACATTTTTPSKTD